MPTKIQCAKLLGTLGMVWIGTAVYAADTSPSFKIVRQWTIANGGFGRIIVLSKPKPTEQELRSLGDALQQLTRGDRNANVEIYDDEVAARNRDAWLEEKLGKRDTRHHDTHLLGRYMRNGNTGYNEYQIYPKGWNGPTIVQRY
ncbi:MAG TPA: hypothetical protein VJT81_01715 [Burkholderiales bacterium]|nr:hypothetical protein [Burkholderiales bacterium]